MTTKLPSVETVDAFLQGHWGPRVRCLSIEAEAAHVELSLRPEDRRPGGYVSGPTQFEIADTALYVLSFGALGRIEPMALTSELSIRFLRPGMGERLFARAHLDRAGGRSLVGTVRVWTDDEERPSAVAQGTYALPASTTQG